MTGAAHVVTAMPVAPPLTTTHLFAVVGSLRRSRCAAVLGVQERVVLRACVPGSGLAQPQEGMRPAEGGAEQRLRPTAEITCRDHASDKHHAGKDGHGRALETHPPATENGGSDLAAPLRCLVSVQLGLASHFRAPERREGAVCTPGHRVLDDGAPRVKHAGNVIGCFLGAAGVVVLAVAGGGYHKGATTGVDRPLQVTQSVDVGHHATHRLGVGNLASPAESVSATRKKEGGGRKFELARGNNRSAQ